MGQRLVVTIEKNEKEICKLYYHWSAYTGDALYITRDIIHHIYNHKDETEKELLLRMIRFCEDRGGGIDGGNSGEEWCYITSIYHNETFKSEGISRSEGLIALSEKVMTDMQRISEGDVYINLDEDRVDFCVYVGYETWSEFIEERKSWDEDFEDCELEDIPYIEYCLGYFDVDEIDGLITAFEKAGDYNGILRCGTEIVELI